MRRNSLLAAGMLSVLLATSACGAVTGVPNSSAPSSVSANAGIEASATHDKSADAVGTTQRAAADKAEAAAAAAEKALTAEKAKEAEAPATAAANTKAAEPKPSSTPAAVPAPAAAPAVAAPAPKPAPAPVLPASSSERIVTTACTTAYTWHDNTPAGSAIISHPILHKTAGGTGTYADPITIAVGHSKATGQSVLDFPAGTRIYLPSVRRYFIVEDTCGDGNDPQNGPCHQGVNANGTNSTIWIDMWIGGESMSASGANECASKVTDVHTAVFDPASNYAVAPGAGVIHDGICDAGYGNNLVKQ
ncbi:MAG: hypothetical protein NVS2B15_15030 [Pseudarthrobacter sp.]